MFCFPLRWRKASRCKKLIRRVRRRLRLLKKRRVSIITQLRDDITQLLLTNVSGHPQAASPLVEQLVHGEGLLTAYDLLDQFCELIIIRLSYIRKNKECPNDINEAVSSLIFASSRCGDLPELREIRTLFGAWYGQKFATVALELLPGNLVNWKVMEKLSVKCVREDEKKRFLQEMAIKHGVQTRPVLVDFSSEPQSKQEEENIVEMERGSDATHASADSRHEYNEESQDMAKKNTPSSLLLPRTNKPQADEVEGFMFPLNDSTTTMEDQRAFLLKTPLSFHGFHGNTSDDEEEGCPERRGRRRKGRGGGVIDMQSSLYYNSCYHRSRTQQKRGNPVIFDGEVGCVLLAVVGCLCERVEEVQRLKKMCYSGGRWEKKTKREEGGRVGCCGEAECPSHVHPNLPNWEEFHARFLALRRAHLNS